MKMPLIKRILNKATLPLAIALRALMPNKYEWAIVGWHGRIMDDHGSTLMSDSRRYLKGLLAKPHLHEFYRQQAGGEVYIVLVRIKATHGIYNL